MKTKYIFASLLVASLTFAGCEDMDTLPEGSTVTSSQKEEIAQQDPTKIGARVNAILRNSTNICRTKVHWGRADIMI